MQGSYDANLVLLSILIAALASYVALEFAGRIFARPEQRGRWLLAGSLAMGSGIWAMHFVGMSAFTLPIAIRYDTGITLLSWVAAVAVSALALWIVSRGVLSAGKVAAGALAMGAGVCVMHYAGMGAMRMAPGIDYDPAWFAASVLIAVGASAAALVIVARLRVVRRWSDIGLRVVAALVMGLAVAGMHYSGMAAARFDPDAMCLSSNALEASSLTAPTAIASLLGLALALLFAIGDARALIRARREARAQAERVVALAFLDRDTGLPNRARFSQSVVEAWAREPRLALVAIRLVAERGAPSPAQVVAAAGALSPVLGEGDLLARGGADQLMLLLPGVDVARLAERVLPALRRRAEGLRDVGLTVAFGVATAPEDGDNVQALLARAGARSAGRGVGHGVLADELVALVRGAA